MTVVRRSLCAVFALGVVQCAVFEPPALDNRRDAGNGGVPQQDSGGTDSSAGGSGGATDASVVDGRVSILEAGRSDGHLGDAVATESGLPSSDAGDSGPSRDDGPWWIVTNEHGCESAGTPTKADRPDPRDEAQSLPPIYLAMSRIRSGDSNDDTALTQNPDAWTDIGLDRDGRCTNSPTCGVDGGLVNEAACRNPATTPFDGNRCIDNSIGKLFGIAASSPLVGVLFGLGDQDWNCELHRGGFSTILKISDYNGKQYDPRVRLDMYVSTGLQRLPGWSCRDTIATPLRANWHTFANWLPSRHWKIAERSIALSAEPDGNEVPASGTFDSTAFVRNGYLYAELPEGREFWFNGERTPVPGFRDIMHRPVLLAELIRQPGDNTWIIENGILSFFVTPDEMLQGFREIGFCENMCNAFDTVRGYQNTNQDTLVTGEILPDVPCNALTLAVDFDARQATATADDVEPVKPPEDCPEPRHPAAPRHGCVCSPDGTICSEPDGGT